MDLLEYDFQNKAVSELVADAKSILRRDKPGILLLDAPTGAGKTVTTAKALARLCEVYAEGLAFIWLAPNMLHEQSREKLAGIYGESKTLACWTRDELMGAEVEDRSILFLNWASVTKGEAGVLTRSGGSETGQTLPELLAATRVAGRKIVLVVDESHRDVNGPEAQRVVRDVLDPDLTIEISATPVFKDYVRRVEIDREEVVRAGVIRKQIVINPGMQDSLSLETSGDEPEMHVGDPGTAEHLLDVAMAHRKKLKEAFEHAGTAINPLVLIQLPDKGKVQSDLMERVKHHLLVNHGLSLEPGGRAAIWLADDKRNLDGIRAHDCPVEVLFFKQAVAAGWDCPRAHILVSLREMMSPTFTAQVLGRVLRQPEHRHYGNGLLDSAYAFTNYPQFKLEKKLEKIAATRMVDLAVDVSFPLPYWYEANADQRLLLTKSSMDAIVRHAQNRLPAIRYRGPVTGAMVSDLRVERLDDLGSVGLLVLDGGASFELGESVLEEKLSAFVIELVAGTAGQLDGRKYVRGALQEIARQVRPNGSQQQALEIILHPGNREVFIEVVGDAIKDLQASFAGKKRSFQEVSGGWAPAKSRVLPWSEKLRGISKYAYTSALKSEFKGREDGIETEFARRLDADPAVVTWLKNRDQGSEHFAIPYKMPDGEKRLFYPDFIAVLTDGRFGIWDTKGHGIDASANHASTPPKAEALAAYRAQRKAEGVDVVGGIVVRDDDGRWMLQDQDSYAWSQDLAGWEPFSI